MTSRLSWIVLLLAAGALIACHLQWFPQLPERVASHFDGAGRANGWMTKAGYAVLPLTHLGIAALIVILGTLIHKLPPAVLNTPRPDYWRQPQHIATACAFVQQWTRWFASALLVWGIFMDRQLFLANLQQPPRLDSSAVNLLTIIFLATTATAIIWMFIRFARPPKDPMAQDNAA